MRSERDKGKMEHVLADIGENPVFRDFSRLWSRKEGAVRPIKITVGSSDHTLPWLSEMPEICAL